MDILSSISDSLYLDFFDSIIDNNMSSPPTRLPSPTIVSPPTNEEALEIIDHRRQAYLRKSAVLKDRIQQERAKTKALIEVYHVGEFSDSALHKRIATNNAWFHSVIRNYNASVDDHQASKVLTDVKMLQWKIREIERKQLAVEVALQQGPDRDIGDGEQDVVMGDGEKVETQMLPVDKLFRTDDAILERIELDDLDLTFSRLEDADESRRNTPLVGWFSV